MIEIIPNASQALKEIRCSNCGVVFRATLDEFYTTACWVSQNGQFNKEYKKAINCPNCNVETLLEIKTPINLD